jgi:CRISPR/Cas system-associated exonuclease Cas4 (RecB family)
MKLPTNFQFSQSNLQDFIDCHRRFQLKHLLHLAWPAAEAEPVLENERLIELGSRFHHLVHQLLLGIPVDELKIPEQESELVLWWHNFQEAITEGGDLHSAFLSSTNRYPEITITGRLGDTRLVAKLDLIAVLQDGTIQIFDWKTTQHVPRRTWLTERLQTKVYPYLLVKAGAFLNNGQSISPDQLEMVYWYPASPETLIRIPYSQNQFQADSAYLQSLVDTLQRLQDYEFPMTSDEQRCKFCVYRSLCNRGIEAGRLGDYENSSSIGEDEAFELDFSEIDEISF